MTALAETCATWLIQLELPARAAGIQQLDHLRLASTSSRPQRVPIPIRKPRLRFTANEGLNGPDGQWQRRVIEGRELKFNKVGGGVPLQWNGPHFATPLADIDPLLIDNSE